MPTLGLRFSLWFTLAGLTAGMHHAVARDTHRDHQAVQVNRTVPAVKPPRSSLSFSPQPSTEELRRAQVFQEPLVVVESEPTAEENAALAAALMGYAKRSGPDDFSPLTAFLERYPNSPWKAALLASLGLEYYNTAHYSLAMEAWSEAWARAKDASDTKARALADRALAELVRMKSRLGRMDEVEALLKSAENRSPAGSAGQILGAAREALWTMKNRPEIAFRCGPLALRGICVALKLPGLNDDALLKTASTQQGCSLPQVAELSAKLGLNYQMAFRGAGGDFMVPSVVHWKVGHYAALVKKAGDGYQLQDPTFGNETWATREALEAETSGYFLVPPGPLPAGWRGVDAGEGGKVWGKGQTHNNDDSVITARDLNTGHGSCRGMTVPAIHLMAVNLNLQDEPVGYAPPVGPPVRLVMRYNQRESFQPANFNYSNFGPQWTCDWISYVTDNPFNPQANVTIYVGGGGQRSFSGFDAGRQTFAPQQYDQTILRRTGPGSYELLSGDGSKLVYSQPAKTIGTTRKVFLKQMVDARGNALTLTYDDNFRLAALTDAIGQVTTLAYGLSDDIYKVTSVTDPFGRSATLNYSQVITDWTYTNHDVCPLPRIDATPIHDIWLAEIQDVIGLSSYFTYYLKTNQLRVSCAVCPTNPTTLLCVSNKASTGFIARLDTPYGVTRFSNQDGDDTKRALEVTYPDGSRERVEFNQAVNIPLADPVSSLPVGVNLRNDLLRYRNTFYWSRTACALGYGDYTKARLYHWLHTESLADTSGALESAKAPLEGRVWYDYAGQGSEPVVIAPSARPAHMGRVLDDGSTQLNTYGYNSFGKLTNSVDPAGRTLSYIYDTNGIDLLEIRQTRVGSELLFKATYNAQHLPLTISDASGQMTTFTYNARGQMLTETDAKLNSVAFVYDTNGYLLSADGALPGTNDAFSSSYDAFGRVRTLRDMTGYQITFDYDALNRATRITHPDGTFSQFSYDRLDCVAIQDRAGRQTLFEYDNLRQLKKKTDPLGRTTIFEWCRCGSLKSLVDPMGRTTSWFTDVEGRRIAKQYGDGSQVQYVYENTIGRLREVIDERRESIVYSYNLDSSLKSVDYRNSSVTTPAVSFTYDPDYRRIVSMKDGIGTTTYHYAPITDSRVLGAGRLASVDGPLGNDTITYEYDELGHPVRTAINGVAFNKTFDAVGRVTGELNPLGSFKYFYDGPSTRLISQESPNGQTATFVYGDQRQDFMLKEISYAVGATPISKFSYGRDTTRRQITTWSQQAGAQPPSIFTFTYDSANQLSSGAVTNSGLPAGAFAYVYDAAGNRLTEAIGDEARNSTFNSLNQLSTRANAAVFSRTNEWDGQHRLTAVTAGNKRTEFGYDGVDRLAYIRQLENGSETSFRRFIWCHGRICEERDATGANVFKRYYPQGMKLETGPSAGSYYYTRDHLGSIRELTDASGNVRARYSYDPFGRRTKVSGDVDADYGFSGMFWPSEVTLGLTRFRAYDPDLGRWLSRDPLLNAEAKEGPNLYAYVRNEPVNRVDPEGLELTTVDTTCARQPAACTLAGIGPVGPSLQAAAPLIVGATLAVEEAGGPDAVEQELISLGQGCQQLAQSGLQFTTSPGIMSDTINETANTAPQFIPQIDEAAQTFMTGAEYEQYLFDSGQICETGLGPEALEAMANFGQLEQQFYDELRDLIPVADSMRLAYQQAVDSFGFDVYRWINYNTSAFR